MSKIDINSYKALANSGICPGKLGALVEQLNDQERAAIYNQLIKEGFDKLVKPLWFNYQTQKFVEGIED